MKQVRALGSDDCDVKERFGLMIELKVKEGEVSHSKRKFLI